MSTRPASSGPDLRPVISTTLSRICCLALILLLPGSAAAEYRIPDITTGEASPPSLTGTAIGISGNLLLVQSAGDEVAVIINRHTHIFTHYGGLVRLGEVCTPSPIEVWFRRPDANARIAPAISVRVPLTC